MKITKERIPSATQLFTPDWIVRYMVENSLGRLVISGQLVVDSGQSLVDSEEERIAKEKELAERFGWKYYLPEAKQDADVREQLNQLTTNNYSPETIKVIDPCMGSGHILVYAFDVLMQIYTQMGYTDKDAALSILENNLYGLDIDKRAFQLAYFAVLMKARQYHKFILKKQPQCHIYAIAESNGINMKHLAYFGAQLDELAKPVALNQMQELITTLHDAKEYGSIISVADYDWELLHQFAAEFDISGEMNLFDSFGIEATQQRLQELVAVGEVLAQKYEVVVTNPPYMGGGSMSAKLSKFVKANFADSKSDLFAIFMEVCHKMNAENGYQAMITQHAWMFLSSFEKLRAKIQKLDIVNMVHLGARAFEEIGGEVVQTTSFIFANKHMDNYKGTYCRLVEPTTQVGKEEMFLAKENRYVACSGNFSEIPGAPVAYWVSDNFKKSFSDGIKIKSLGRATLGMRTGDNERFLRLWFEIENVKFYSVAYSAKEAKMSAAKWFPYNKGGKYRKWYGNTESVVNWENDGYEIKENTRRVYPQLGDNLGWKITSEDKYFTKGIAWSRISSSNFGVRLCDSNLIFDTNAPMFFPNDDKHLKYIAAFMCSKIAGVILSLLNPTLTFQVVDVANLPVIFQQSNELAIENIVDKCYKISKSDWDAFETSWDFTKHSLVVTSGQLLVNRDSSANDQLTTTHYPLTTIAQAYQRWEEETNARFTQLKANEEELNRIFIDIYGLQDELTPEVEDKDVTVRKADLQRDIKSLLSYAVGCMFGRYSLDVEGLAYAGGEWDESKYVTFKPDEDNVIPITDEDYFEDDIIGRLIAWLKVVYGAETLEENLRFIADALGTSGDTARQKIRNYFLKDFFKDHCKIYQKRPIYWLYDSGKQNGFKALIYMHRYNADTSGQVRAEYLGKMEETYESEINRMQDIMDNGAGREVALAGKRKEKLQKQLHECRDYDAVLGHIALASIAIDLDDGVKVNYVKVQTAKDGKLLPILAKI